ncbi:MAG TPA: hypothetical protein VGN73_13305 [Gemmatimonadaceae bacterium]|jgi:hypothetical protein|nr:hypothetical protein [Gemmatimonadaceae bacterium]
MSAPVAERIANIGAGERRKRLLFGIFALVVGAVIAGLLIAVGSPLLWRLPLILVFYAGALGVFQSLDKT